MKRLILAAALVAALATGAQAQVGQVVAGKETGGTARTLLTDATGRLLIVGSGVGGVAYGADASGAVPTQAPIAVAGYTTTAAPTCTNGRICYASFDTAGNLRVAPSGTVTVTGTVAATQSGAWNVGQTGTWTVQPGNTANTTPWLFNQSQINGVALSSGAGATGTGTQRVGVAQDTTTIAGSAPGTAGSASANVVTVQGVASMTPLLAGNISTAATVAVAPVSTTAVGSSLVVKASAGNLYRYRINTGTTAGYVMVFNATSLPANGAVTPLQCTVAPASSTIEVDHSLLPDRFGTGITIGFSTTGCLTQTASATALSIEAVFQ